MATSENALKLPFARTAVEMAMQKQGRDFVYAPIPGPCMYVPADDPRTGAVVGWGPLNDSIKKTGCLVGEALALLGLRTDAVAVGGGSVYSLWSDGRVAMTEQTREYLQIVQDVQDRGSTWGEAFDKAESEVERIKRNFRDSRTPQ